MSNSLNIGGALSGAVDNMLSGSIAGNIQLDGGGSANLKSLSVFANGEYLPPEGYDGFDSVIVDIPIKEEITANITENGTYTPPAEKVYSEVVVAVPIPSPVLQSKSISENGTYTPPSGVDGFNEVVVNVPTPTPPLEMVNVWEIFREGSMTVSFDSSQNIVSWTGGSSIGFAMSSNFSLAGYNTIRFRGHVGTSYNYNFNVMNNNWNVYLFLTKQRITSKMIPANIINSPDTYLTHEMLDTKESANYDFDMTIDISEYTDDFWLYFNADGDSVTFTIEVS